MVLGLYLMSLCEPVVSELVETFLSQMHFLIILYYLFQADPRTEIINILMFGTVAMYAVTRQDHML